MSCIRLFFTCPGLGLDSDSNLFGLGLVLDSNLFGLGLDLDSTSPGLGLVLDSTKVVLTTALSLGQKSTSQKVQNKASSDPMSKSH